MMVTLRFVGIAVISVLFAEAAFAATRSGESEIRRLVDEIATGRDSGAAAADRLLETLTQPIADAFAEMEKRSPQDQLRLRPVLRRLQAQIRIRLFRSTLNERQRQLLDTFADQQRELLEQLFDDSEYVRMDALHRIPLEPGTAAGILIVARVDDWNETVAEQALEVAREFRDEQVVMGLTRYVADVVATLRAGVYGPNDQDVARAIGVWAQTAIAIIGEARYRDALPVITDAVEYFDKWRYRDAPLLGGCLDALGLLGDEQSAPLLIRFLEQRERRFSRTIPGERTVVQTLGDAALLNLLRIYKLSPDSLGFAGDPQRTGLGFSDERSRAAAQQAFLRWYEVNGNKPADQRAALPTLLPATSAPSPENR